MFFDVHEHVEIENCLYLTFSQHVLDHECDLF